MKFLSFSVMLLLGVAACNQTQKNTNTDTKPKFVTIKLVQLASAKDMVCGMPLKEGEVADTANYSGKAYGFCSPECKAEFGKKPQSYLTQN